MRDPKLEIKNKIDIVHLIEDSGVHLKDIGNGNHIGLCPFHNDTNPSLRVSEEYQNYKCFACGASGDIFTYFMNFQNLTFMESYHILAEKAGVKVEEHSEEHTLSVKKAYDLTKMVAVIYRENFINLPRESEAVQNIIGRNLDPSKSYYGWSSENKLDTWEKLKAQGALLEDLVELKLLNEDGTDPFYGRLIFFFTNSTGKFIGFSGRAMPSSNSNAKYKNSAQSVIYNKSKVLYNEYIGRDSITKEEKVYVTEGPFDVVAMADNGYRNTVCSSGTAFTKEQGERLARMTKNGKIVFIMDPDEAGQKALYSIIKNVPKMQELGYVVSLPEGLDPCDYFKENKELPKEQGLVEYVFHKIKSSYKMNDPIEVSSFLEEMTKNFLPSINRGALLDSYIAQVSYYAKEPRDRVELMIRNRLKRNTSSTNSAPTKKNSSSNKSRDLIGFWIKHRKHLPELDESLFTGSIKDLVKELNKFKDTSPFIPDLFEEVTHQEAVKSFLDYYDEYEMNEVEIREHYDYLKSRVENVVENKKKLENRRAIEEALNEESMTNEQIAKLLEDYKGDTFGQLSRQQRQEY